MSFAKINLYKFAWWENGKYILNQNKSPAVVDHMYSMFCWLPMFFGSLSIVPDHLYSYQKLTKLPLRNSPFHWGPFLRNMWSREHTSTTCYPRRHMFFLSPFFFHGRKWKVMGRFQSEAGGCEVWSGWLLCNTRWYDTGWYYSPQFYLLQMKRLQGRFEGQWCSLVHVVAWKISEEITSISLYSAWWNADGLVPSFVSGG